MNDVSCLKQICSICDIPERPTLSIRGNCADTQLDTRYTWSGAKSEGGRFIFRGWTNTELRFDKADARWILKMSESDNVYATYNESDEYPFGKRDWAVIGEPCFNEESKEVTLQISSCGEEEFSCDNGICIPMEDRCNRRAECQDRSDEKNCQTIALDETYLAEYPPLGPKGTVGLTVDVTINGILDISEVGGTFRVQFVLAVSWMEPRISFYNLKEEKPMNSLLSVEREQIWTPTLIMDNTEKKLETLNGGATFIEVKSLQDCDRNLNFLNRSIDWESLRGVASSSWTIRTSSKALRTRSP